MTVVLIILGVLFVLWLLAELKTSRPDGTFIKINPARRLMFYIMPTRTESVVYFDAYADARPLLAYLKKAKSFGANMTHAIVAAGEVGVATNPRMNRFVAGKRLYARKTREITFSMKRKRVSDSSGHEARLATVKMETSKSRTFKELCTDINDKINENRSGKKTYADKEFQLFDLLPRSLLSFAAGALQKLDYYNLMPGSFIKNDPLYTSMFIANLGSIKMGPGFHHLFEYGSCHIFLMVGEVAEVLEMQDGKVVSVPRIHLRYTYDERAEDAINCRHGMASMIRVIEDPERWLGCVAEDGSDVQPIWPRDDWETEDGIYKVRN